MATRIAASFLLRSSSKNNILKNIHQHIRTMKTQPLQFASLIDGILPTPLHHVHETFGKQMPDIQKAQMDAQQQGKLIQSREALERALQVSFSVRDSLVMVYTRRLIARCEYLIGDLHAEIVQRAEIVKLLDQLLKERKSDETPSEGESSKADITNAKTINLIDDSVMCKQSMSAYMVALLRVGDVDAVQRLILRWTPWLDELHSNEAIVRMKAMQAMTKFLQLDTHDAEIHLEEMASLARSKLSVKEARLAEADSALLLGVIFQHTDAEKARKHFQNASKLYDEHNPGLLKLDAGGFQLPMAMPHLYLGELGDREAAKLGLKLAEEALGATHWLSIDALRIVADTYVRDDPTTAEGLFRTAINYLEKPAPYLSTASFYIVQVDTLSDYASLLHQMEFNGRSRAPEAQRLINRVREIQALHPDTRPTSKRIINRPGKKQVVTADDTDFTLERLKSPRVPDWFVERFTA